MLTAENTEETRRANCPQGSRGPGRSQHACAEKRTEDSAVVPAHLPQRSSTLLTREPALPLQHAHLRPGPGLLPSLCSHPVSTQEGPRVSCHSSTTGPGHGHWLLPNSRHVHDGGLEEAGALAADISQGWKHLQQLPAHLLPGSQYATHLYQLSGSPPPASLYPGDPQSPGSWPLEVLIHAHSHCSPEQPSVFPRRGARSSHHSMPRGCVFPTSIGLQGQSPVLSPHGPRPQDFPYTTAPRHPFLQQDLGQCRCPRPLSKEASSLVPVSPRWASTTHRPAVH